MTLLLLVVGMPIHAWAAPTADEVISDLYVNGAKFGGDSGIGIAYVGDDVGAQIGGAYAQSYASGINRANYQNEWIVRWPVSVLDNGTVLSSGGAIRGIAQCNRIAVNTRGNGVSNASATHADVNLNLDDPYTTVTEDGENRCWCKMTGVSGKSAADISVAGDWMSPRGAAWVFRNTYGSAADCAYYCAYYCANLVRGHSAFRAAVFGVGALGMPRDTRACGQNLVNSKLYDYQLPATATLTPSQKYTVSIATNSGANWAFRIRRVSDGTALTALSDIKAVLASSDLKLDDSAPNAAADVLSRGGWVFGTSATDNPSLVFEIKGNNSVLVDIAKIDANGSQNLMLEMGDTASAYVAPVKCVGKIETVDSVNAAFDRTRFVQDIAVRVITKVVQKTISQADAIGTISAEKQTRPADDYTDAQNTENCPAGQQCLLVEGADGASHWYKIFDPVQWFMGELWANNETCRYEKSGNNWTYYNGFYKGDATWRKTYVDGSTSTYNRPFAHSTRCTNHNFNTETPNAEPCYNTMTGAFHTLTDGEWAVVFEGGEGTGGTITNSAVRPGIVYGESKCTSVAGPNNYASAHPTKYSELSAANQAKWNLVPNPVGTEDDANNPRSSYTQCWCKMTGVGVNDAASTVADLTSGKYYPVRGAAWVFDYTYSSAAVCARICAVYCADRVRDNSAFRAAVFGVGAN